MCLSFVRTALDNLICSLFDSFMDAKTLYVFICIIRWTNNMVCYYEWIPILLCCVLYLDLPFLSSVMMIDATLLRSAYRHTASKRVSYISTNTRNARMAHKTSVINTAVSLGYDCGCCTKSFHPSSISTVGIMCHVPNTEKHIGEFQISLFLWRTTVGTTVQA